MLTWKIILCSKLHSSTTRLGYKFSFLSHSFSLALSIALKARRSSQSTCCICPLSYLLTSLSKRSISPLSFLGTYKLHREKKVSPPCPWGNRSKKEVQRLAERELQQMNPEFKKSKRSVTLPGVVVGTPPSASFLGHSRSFCLPVLSCLLLLKRNMVAPPTISGSSPDETSHTYIRD